MTPSETMSHEGTVATDRSTVFVELTKPRITLMVLLTVAMGFFLADSNFTSPWSMLHVLIATGLSCSGAGALNQYIERYSDGMMHRTRFRPLPARQVHPSTVLALGILLVATGVIYLATTVGVLAAGLNAATALSYLLLYTPLKRSSSLSTLAGAVPGALPPVIGWAAATQSVEAGAWVLFGILFLWQIPHFLAIGQLYRKDYADAGFPMLVVLDTEGTRTGRQMVLYAVALIPVSLLLPFLGLAGRFYFWSALVLGTGYLAVSAASGHRGDRASARRVLLTSVLYLPLLFLSMAVDRFLP